MTPYGHIHLNSSTYGGRFVDQSLSETPLEKYKIVINNRGNQKHY